MGSCRCLKVAWQHSRGKLFGVLACVSMVVIFMLVKITNLPPLVPFFYRSLFAGQILLTIVVYSCGRDAIVQLRRSGKLLMLRSAFDAAGAALFYSSLAYFPLTELGFLAQTQTAFTMGVAFLVLGEKPSLFQVVCAVGAMGGAVLVIQPPILGFQSKEAPSSSSSQDGGSVDSDIRFYIGCAVISLGLIVFAFGATIMRRLASSGHMHWALVALFQSLFCLLFGSMGLLATGDGKLVVFMPCELTHVKLPILSIVLCSITLQLSLFYCLKYEKASMLSILLTVQVLFMPVGDFVLNGWSLSSVPFNPFHYSGFLLILASVLSLFIAKHISVLTKQQQQMGSDGHIQDKEEDDCNLHAKVKEEQDVSFSNSNTSVHNKESQT